MTENAFTDARLPNQYHFTSKDNVRTAEVIALRESVNWQGDTPERWQDCIDQSLAVIGVRDSESNLIGMACISGNLRHAVLCDLVVHPTHQHKGIGTALMSELLRVADDIGICYLYAELAETNPFRDSMMRSGFKVTGNSLFRDSIAKNL